MKKLYNQSLYTRCSCSNPQVRVSVVNYEILNGSIGRLRYHPIVLIKRKDLLFRTITVCSKKICTGIYSK